MCTDDPNNTFIQLRKNRVGAIKYRRTTKIRQSRGNKSKQKLKNRTSATNIIDPGNPKNTNKLTKLIKKSLGHIKLIPLTSVISRVLKRRAIASTSKNELVERRAWLISIQNPASINEACPLIIQIVSQCISTTVE
jgi:hypothetical protein